MIFLTGFQIAELRKVPTTRITHAILEESPVTPLVLKVTECYPDGSNSEYEVSQEGKRRNAA
jgi:hypothetical protein